MKVRNIHTMSITVDVGPSKGSRITLWCMLSSSMPILIIDIVWLYVSCVAEPEAHDFIDCDCDLIKSKTDRLRFDPLQVISLRPSFSSISIFCCANSFFSAALKSSWFHRYKRAGLNLTPRQSPNGLSVQPMHHSTASETVKWLIDGSFGNNLTCPWD